MKLKPFQVYHDILELIPGTTEKTFILATGRANGVIQIMMTAINPRGTDKMKNVNRVIKIKGVECDLDAPVDVDDETAKVWVDPIYLSNGHEFGLRIDGEKVDSTCRVYIHYVWCPEEMKALASEMS